MSYSKNTIRRAEQILGYGISDGTGTRTFTVIDGIIYTDLFEGVPTIDGLDDYRVTFNGHANADYSNQIHVYCRDGQEVDITANWGSNVFNTEIEELLDWLEANPITDSLDNAGTKSIRIKDTAETFNTGEEQTQTVNDLLNSGYGYYIRRPLIIGISSEKSDAARYF